MCRRPPKRELALADIPTNVSALSFLRGTSGDTIESHAVNARTGELMGQLHDIAAQGFSDPDTPEAYVFEDHSDRLACMSDDFRAHDTITTVTLPRNA